ncbi:MAG TPA: lysophospholipid acyltransferase family protein [Pseudomonadales bacterium]|nr:lysophospholipid acyltransferase family protein [Pseudomonadales bacterium]
MNTLFGVLQTLAFYAGSTLVTVVWGSLGVLTGWLLPYRARFIYIVVIWTHVILGWLRLTCGISHVVRGREHLPESPCVVLVRHESTWETLFMQQLLVPQTTVIKRELLHIPFFGWAFRMLRPIAINRSDARGALKGLIRSGRNRLADGIWVVLFPEGTRMQPGEAGRFQRGGAALAKDVGCPVVVVAHNAGQHWPARRWLKRPGVIEVEISPPIDTTGKTTPQITDEAQAWLDTAMRRFYPDYQRPGAQEPGARTSR